jgi:hypothetical protein
MNLRLIFFLVVILACIVVSVFFVPLTFANDQEKYFDIVKKSIFDVGIEAFQPGGLKFISMYLFSRIQIIFVDSIYGLKILNFSIFSFLLFLYIKGNKYNNIFLILFIPTVLLHSTLFLREIYVYLLLILFFLTNIRIIKAIFLILIGLLRYDSLILILPLVIYIGYFRHKSILYLFLIVASILFYQSDIYNAFLDGYLRLFQIDKPGIFNAFLNFYFPIQGNLPGYLFAVLELIFLGIFFNLNRSIMLFLTVSIVGAIFLGSASDNIGFILRLRSPLIFAMFLHLVLGRYATTNSINTNFTPQRLRKHKASMPY